MTAADFRKLALALSGASEGSHIGHADFCVGGKIFATRGYPDDLHGTIMLSPLDQDLLLQRQTKAFKPAAGAWGKAGSTSVILKAAPSALLRLHSSRRGSGARPNNARPANAVADA